MLDQRGDVRDWAQEPVEVSLRCISDITRDVLGLNKNGPELCSWIILYVYYRYFCIFDQCCFCKMRKTMFPTLNYSANANIALSYFCNS